MKKDMEATIDSSEKYEGLYLSFDIPVECSSNLRVCRGSASLNVHRLTREHIEALYCSLHEFLLTGAR